MANEPLDLQSMSMLVPKAKAGDDIARNEVCKQIQEYLERMADKKLDAQLRRRVNPADIVQQTMTRMISAFEGFRGSSSAEFYGWLNRILENEINSTRRNSQRDKRDVRRESEVPDKSGIANAISPTDPNLTPGSEAIKTERLDQFHRVLEKLPPDYAEVIRLRSLEERSFKDVAEIMDKSYDAASKLWYRAIVKFQDEIEKLDDSL